MTAHPEHIEWHWASTQACCVKRRTCDVDARSMGMGSLVVSAPWQHQPIAIPEPGGGGRKERK